MEPQNQQQPDDPNKLNGQNISGPSTIRPPPQMRPPPPRPQMGQLGQPGQIRPPMPGNMARPPIPGNMVRPPIPGNMVRPPMPSNVVRPPMPSADAVRPPIPNIAVRPPMPSRPMAPHSLSPSPKPPTPTTEMPARPPQQRPPLSAPVVPSQPPLQRPPMPGPPINSQINVQRPPVPAPLMPMRPPIPAPVSAPTSTPMAMPMSTPPTQSTMSQAPIRPPIPGQLKSPVVNGPPIPGLSQPSPMTSTAAPPVMRPAMPMAPPSGPSIRPPMPMTSSAGPSIRPPLPMTSSAGPSINPPLPNMSSIPQAASPTTQMPPVMRPPIPSVRPQMPAPLHGGQPPQMRPPMPINSQPRSPIGYSTTSTGYPAVAPSAPQPQMPGYNPQQQQYPSQGFAQHGFSQTHSGQPLPGAPQSVSSSSHNMNEFYEEYNPLIKPNIHSDYLSCSLGKIPRNSSILGKTRTPFGLTVSFYPYGDEEKDKVAEVTGQIVRCRRCRTYLNPFAELIEQGSRWRCNICYLANEFPPNYDFDPVSQRTIERKDHVELNSFVYDFTNAPIEYTVRPPQPPIFLFALEVTASAVNSGLFAASCRVIQEQLDAIPNQDGRARVALLTFDQRIQFYQMSPNEANAKVLVVADAAEPFLPAFSDLLVNLAECRSQLDALLEQLPQMYSTPSKASPALGPVLRSAHLLLKSIGGKIVVICSSLPTQFEGALKPRDDLKLLGTPKESTLLQPANQFYKLFASEIVKDQICIDLFVAPPQLTAHTPIYVDLATISGLTKYTGGKLYYYPEFGTSEAISSKFCSDLRRFLGQAHGFEAVLRIRASQGISLSAYHGSFFLRQTDLLSLPNVNPDHSFTAQASIDENLQGTVVCFQAALLHTTSRSERRIRVINFSVPVTDDIKEVFSHMNVNGIAGLLSKMAVEKVLANRLEDAREAVLNKCSDVIAAFKSQYGLKTNPNILLPENMRNFAIVLHALTKTTFLKAGSSIHPDLRAHYLTLFKTLSVQEILGILLPRFYAIHSMDSDCGVNGKLPNLLNLSSEKLERHGVFLLENGLQQFLWIGSNVHPELLKMLFGTSATAQIPSGRATQLIPDLDNDWNRRLRAISETLRTKFSKNIQPELFIVKEESDPVLRQLFMANLVEDRAVDGSAQSYAQWLTEVTTRVNTSSY